MVDMLFKEPGQYLVFRCKVALAHNPPSPFSFLIKDKQAPAAIVPADLRAGQVDSTVPLFRCPVITEKRACLRAFQKNLVIAKECYLVRINTDRCFFTGVLVVYKEAVIPVVLPDGMDQPEMAATFPALAAFKRHSSHRIRIPDIALPSLNLTGSRQDHQREGEKAEFLPVPWIKKKEMPSAVFTFQGCRHLLIR
jgi:hypothetical protein